MHSVLHQSLSDRDRFSRSVESLSDVEKNGLRSYLKSMSVRALSDARLGSYVWHFGELDDFRNRTKIEDTKTELIHKWRDGTQFLADGITDALYDELQSFSEEFVFDIRDIAF